MSTLFSPKNNGKLSKNIAFGKHVLFLGGLSLYFPFLPWKIIDNFCTKKAVFCPDNPLTNGKICAIMWLCFLDYINNVSL